MSCGVWVGVGGGGGGGGGGNIFLLHSVLFSVSLPQIKFYHLSPGVFFRPR
eukprot:COSAG06_NODE_2175_length_7411_cov_86.745897_1_plen_50_part_10